MGGIASQITSLTIVYSIVYSDADQRKHQSSASLAFVRGIHRVPGNFPHKWPVTRKMFPFDDVIMVLHLQKPHLVKFRTWRSMKGMVRIKWSCVRGSASPATWHAGLVSGHWKITLQWRLNTRDCVSNHQPRRCLLNCVFRRKSKKTSKLHVTGLCAGNSPVTSEFPAQMASNAGHVSIWWRHHTDRLFSLCSIPPASLRVSSNFSHIRGQYLSVDKNTYLKS